METRDVLQHGSKKHSTIVHFKVVEFKINEFRKSVWEVVIQGFSEMLDALP